MRFLLALCFLLPGLAHAQAQPADAVLTFNKKVELPSGTDKGSGRLFRDSNEGKHPALVLIHEWWGLNDFAKNKASGLAAAGYVVLAVDLYRGKVAADADEAHQLSRGLPADRALRDLRAAIDVLAKEKDVDPKRIGVIGWCMGGGFATELTTADPRIAATVVYYGALPTDAAKVAKIKAPFLGSFGADDKGIAAADVRAFEAVLKKQGTAADIKIYPGAGHAFATTTSDNFRPEAAKDADARVSAFLAKTLGAKR